MSKVLKQVCRDLESETRLANARSPTHRQQADLLFSQERNCTRCILLASNQRGELYGKIMLWRWLRLTELLSYSARRWKSDDGGLLNLHSIVSKSPRWPCGSTPDSFSSSLNLFCHPLPPLALHL